MTGFEDTPDQTAFHFLVVDDDEQSRATIVEYLNAMGYQRITECVNGADAIGMLDVEPSINFIVSDWDMPLMNGLSLLQRVKSNPARANLPFLIVTTPISQEAEKIMLAAENLVDGYLIKPFRSQALKEKIEATLSVAIRGPQKQAVVVDDDHDARSMICEYLRELGFKDIVSFPDGQSALTHILSHASRIGMIISDWEMPTMSGIELLKACKTHEVLELVPFLMVTSQTSIENMKIMQAAKAGVDEYLLKPFVLGDIRKKIETLIEEARTRSEVKVVIAEALDHLEHSRYQRALTRFHEALKLDPKNQQALRYTGELTKRVSGIESALPHFKKYVEFHPAQPVGYINLASVYDQLGWIDKAIALLETANAQISFNADLHFHLGKLFHRKGLVDEARTEFEKTLEIQLDHQEAKLLLGALGAAKGKSGGSPK